MGRLKGHARVGTAVLMVGLAAAGVGILRARQMQAVPTPSVVAAAYWDGYRAVSVLPDSADLTDRPCSRAWNALHPDRPWPTEPPSSARTAFQLGCYDKQAGFPPSSDNLMARMKDD